MNVINSLAPIVVFVYNRLDHIKLTIDSLKKNPSSTESDLIIYSDAPKSSNFSHSVNEVRKYIKEIKGFKNVAIIERKRNLGLSNSIIFGVTEVLNKYGKVIVLEDDMYLSEYFLEYMNDALNLYEDEDTVVSIHAYCYPINKKLPETFFLKGADCWGWGTWSSGWEVFEKDGKKLLKELERNNLTKKFDFNNTYSYTEMLIDQIAGKNNSWAIRWYASAFLKNKLTLYPGRSLVYNIGNDNSGTHCISTEDFDTIVSKTPIILEKINIKENKVVFKEFERFFRSLRGNYIKLFLRKIKGLLFQN